MEIGFKVVKELGNSGLKKIGVRRKRPGLGVGNLGRGSLKGEKKLVPKTKGVKFPIFPKKL